MVRCRIFMLVYNAGSEVPAMTRYAVDRALETTAEDVRLTVAFNGGDTFPLAEHERMTVLAWPERLSLGVAYNQLVNATNEPYVCLLHNDCFVSEGWLEPLIETAQVDGFAFPRVFTDKEELKRRRLDDVSDSMPPSCCYVVKRRAWDTLGGFDREYAGCHFEDMDLFLRAKIAGYELSRVHGVEVWHKRGVTRVLTGKESNDAFIANRAIYAGKWQDGATIPLPSVRE